MIPWEFADHGSKTEDRHACVLLSLGDAAIGRRKMRLLPTPHVLLLVKRAVERLAREIVCRR
jgi:hypothetical protein